MVVQRIEFIAIDFAIKVLQTNQEHVHSFFWVWRGLGGGGFIYWCAHVWSHFRETSSCFISNMGNLEGGGVQNIARHRILTLIPCIAQRHFKSAPYDILSLVDYAASVWVHHHLRTSQSLSNARRFSNTENKAHRTHERLCAFCQHAHAHALRMVGIIHALRMVGILMRACCFSTSMARQVSGACVAH